MADRNTNDRIAAVEKEVKGLRNQLVRLNSEIDAIRQENKASVSRQQTPEQKDDTAKGKPAIKAEIPPTPTNCLQPKKPWYRTLYGWKKFLEMIPIPFAIGYAIVTWFLWHDANRNFRSEQRAWITVEPVDPQHAVRLQIGDPIQFPITFGNSGKSPAFRVNLKARLITLGPSDELSFFYAAPRINAQAGIMFPNQNHPQIVPQVMKDGPSPSSPQAIPLDSETNAKIMSGELMIFMYGEITYEDEFNNAHWAHFCQSAPQVMVGFPTPAIEKCLAYNAVDQKR